jgi:Xaa-Pro aminopeptidase
VDHRSRRARLLERLSQLDGGAFLVTRLPNVRYLTGFSGSNAQLLLTAEDAVLFTDGRYAEQSRRETPDVRREIYSGEFGPVFAAACSDLGLRRVSFEAAGLTFETYAKLAESGAELVPTTQEVESLRWVKDGEEVGLIESAQAIVDEAFDAVLGAVAEGMTEHDMALGLDTAMRRSGAEGLAFDTIVAFGEGAAEPHHRPTSRALARGDAVKVDMGCTYRGYNSDMTRTVAFGEPSATFRQIYDVVRTAQRAGVDAVRAGASGGEVDRVARDIIREAGFGEKYGHSLGHGVGLEVHEGPSLRANGDDVLPSGAVVTVEPGIYLEGIGGVRIEDMVVVENDGARVIPRTSKELLIL